MSLVEFEEWFDDEYSNYGKSYKERYDERNDMYSSQFVDERYDAFKAGQQSQQGEVNKLQTKIDELNERNSEEKRILHNVIEMNQTKIDELQARIDEVLKACDNLRTDLLRENHVEYDKGWKDCATSIYYQLRGNKT